MYKNYYDIKKIFKFNLLTREIVSFSLFGQIDSHYCDGLFENIELWENYNVDVSFTIFCTQSIFDSIKNKIKAKRYWIFVMNDDKSRFYPSLWRYLILKKVGFFYSGIIHFRDLDSRLSKREICIIEEFKKSTLNYLIIRDHPLQQSKIMAGLFSVKNRYITRFIFKRFFNSSDSDFYGVDQVLLSNHVYPYIVDGSYIFDPFNHFHELNRQNLLLEREGFEFCGECFLQDNQIDSSENGRKYLEKYLMQRNK